MRREAGECWSCCCFAPRILDSSCISGIVGNIFEEIAMPVVCSWGARLAQNCQNDNTMMQSKSKKCGAHMQRHGHLKPCIPSLGNRHYLLFHCPARNQKREGTQQMPHHLPLFHKQLAQGTDFPPSCTVDTSPRCGPYSVSHKDILTPLVERLLCQHR